MSVFSFIVTNEDLQVDFSCANYEHRIREAITNLRITSDHPQSREQLEAIFEGLSPYVSFLINDCIIENGRGQSVFFENTDYPIYAHALKGKSISDLTLFLSKHQVEDTELKDVIRSDHGVLYGALNFKNQVGLVDFLFTYTVNGVQKSLGFTTEVLSFKMNYRTDMKVIIKDIEEEYAMLSYSFLKQTYLSFKTEQGQSTELIWWQIFQSCYQEIINATKIIINTPKRRLKTSVRFERIERLPFIGPQLENEYEEFKDEPIHRYRTEELILSKDTIENRFLKHVIQEVYRRFNVIRKHIKNSLNVDDAKIGYQIETMDTELLRLQNNPFFHGIGTFKGLTQDSMVLKQARGYKDIFRCWIELQCGYELEDGIRRLEVKDISELYEIWCFIKVKNIVADILGEDIIATSSGQELTTGFIRQLVYGNQSDVSFSKGNVELATVQYNAQVEEEENLNAVSAIRDTDSLTTVQRPDIVLRLSKEGDDIRYTYLFDAKYRIADVKKNGFDVPPVDAINQMHRYRDAIYYIKSPDEKLKREIIGGYVLYPGNLSASEYEKSYFKTSADRIGIGAFPLKPTEKIVLPNGTLDIDPNSSEIALRKQIEEWLRETNPRQRLLNHAIPQKGLFYTDIEDNKSKVLLIAPTKEANGDLTPFKEERAKVLIGGKLTHEALENKLLLIRYIIVILKGEYHGWYPVKSVSLEMIQGLDPPMRVKFELGNFIPFPEGNIKDGIVITHSKGRICDISEIIEKRKKLNKQ